MRTRTKEISLDGEVVALIAPLTFRQVKEFSIRREEAGTDTKQLAHIMYDTVLASLNRAETAKVADVDACLFTRADIEDEWDPRVFAFVLSEILKFSGFDSQGEAKAAS